jgi:DNA-directed RNA polymerase specialized sigma24 family protein
MSLKAPGEWTDEERRRVAIAIAEHRLSRVDLFLWQEADLKARSARDLGVELMLTPSAVRRRVDRARERLQAAFDLPSQEAYLWKWLDT